MRFFKFVVFLLFSCNTLFGQQTYQFSQYYFNKFLYNPAFAGHDDFIDVKSGFRSQWNGISSSNQSFYLSGTAALGKKDYTSDGPVPNISSFKPIAQQNSTIRKSDFKPSSHQGIGLMITNDVWGPVTTLSISASYAFHIPLGGEKKMSGGFSIGNYARSIDLSPNNFDVSNPNDILLNSEGKLRTSQNLINLGFSYYDRDGYLGASALQPIMETYNYSTSMKDTTKTLSSFGSFPSVFIFHGSKRKILSDDWRIYADFLIKYININRVTAEGTLRARYKENVWGGLSFRFKESIGLHAGFRLSSSLLVNYSYDFQNYVGPFTRSLTSNEITLAYMFYWKELKLK